MLRLSNTSKFYHFYPNIVCVVVVAYENKINAMPVAWSSGVSSNPRYFSVMISKKRYTYGLISKAKKFSVNFLDWKYLDLVDKLGSFSGRDIDKIKEFNIPIEKGIEEGVFYIPFSYSVYECRLVKNEELGDHNFIVGEVINIWIDESVFDENEKPVLEKVSPIFYLGSGEYVRLKVVDKFKEV